MNLPRTKFADTNSLWRQYFHLVSEVWEVGKALISRNYCDVGEELVDVQISAHTMRHILNEKKLAPMDACEWHVIRKGQVRGYYK